MSRTMFPSVCRRCKTQFTISEARRPFSSTHVAAVEDAFDPFKMAFGEYKPKQRVQRATNPRSDQTERQTTQTSTLFSPQQTRATPSQTLLSLAETADAESKTRPFAGASSDEPYHLNIYAHKHNTHITFTEPSRGTILTFSAGNIGLKKAQRGSFDAAYQLSTYTMRKMAEKQWRVGGKKSTNRMMTLNEPDVRDRGIEVVMRGFGPGREAFQKALLGTEGRVIKGLVNKVTDDTRLKFGGVRSPQVRRLG